ncbi:MAG: YggS family pyridoxal phosphate-dependent enzyme [Amphibacillus sp.]|nr:YggS family pyridoxal phosphate-dependent enzyme [Amphibacillus sp.]
MSIEENIIALNQEIKEICKKAGRAKDEITLIAVTKYVTIERTKEVVNAGVADIAENRLEGLLEKQTVHYDHPVTWHFIGNLQSRKVKGLINQIDYFHALDRISIAKEINKRAEKEIKCFVQVNVSGEATKNGLKPEEVIQFIDELKAFNKIKVVGLMTMAPHTRDEAIIRSVFQKLRALRDEVMNQQWEHAPCQGLSMGMSNDYQIAIEEGATHLRIGSLIVNEEG